MCLVIKTTCVDRGKPLREGAFFFARRTLFLPLDKRNTCDKAKGLLGHFGEIYRWALDVRYLSTRNRGQDSQQQSLLVYPLTTIGLYAEAVLLSLGHTIVPFSTLLLMYLSLSRYVSYIEI